MKAFENLVEQWRIYIETIFWHNWGSFLAEENYIAKPEPRMRRSLYPLLYAVTLNEIYNLELNLLTECRFNKKFHFQIISLICNPFCRLGILINYLTWINHFGGNSKSNLVAPLKCFRVSILNNGSQANKIFTRIYSFGQENTTALKCFRASYLIMVIRPIKFLRGSITLAKEITPLLNISKLHT